jgi:LmbE family N-acetylglucosaminyl deacetylase
MRVDPRELFQGTIVIVAPHMDDEVLACGGTIAHLPQKEQIHVIYATDGMKSPAPIVPWQDAISPDLGEVRVQESRAAMQFLGVPGENTHFLRLPEAELSKHVPALRRGLLDLIGRLKPAHILIPFRYDRHPDHLAINHIITAAHKQHLYQGHLTEYFVYYRWRLLPGRDVRQYIQPKYLLEVDTQEVSTRKRTALDCFKSQTTKFYPWQTRPILTSILLDEVSQTPELFLRYDASAPGAAVFSRAVPWIRIAHRLEPFLQRWKYQIGAFLRRGVQKNDSQAT